jgi:uncharacterized protein DUF1924
VVGVDTIHGDDMDTGSRTWAILAAAGATALAFPALAAAPAELQKRFEAEARAAAGFAGFSPQRGERFFRSAHGGDWSCASCHTDNPLAAGRHAKTGKAIAPLAPAANRERFTDAAAAEKWFRRNCNDVLGRACTAQEKGDVLEYLMSLK